MYSFKKKALFQATMGKPTASEAAGEGQGWRVLCTGLHHCPDPAKLPRVFEQAGSQPMWQGSGFVA